MACLRTAQNILSPILTPAGHVYGAVMGCRANLFSRGTFTRFNPSCPCVSVGNIGSGGSGKTPLSGWLLKWAHEQGMESVLLTRGYGASPTKFPCLVTAETPVKESGDEPLMLATDNPYARVIVDPIRKRSGKWAMESFQPDFIVLDDGFQHMAVQRDLDFVLMTPDDFAEGWNKVIPRGTWRETEAALCRADCFFVKSSVAEFNSMKGVIKERLGEFKKPVFQFNLKAESLISLKSGDSAPFGCDKFLLVSGIGKPDQFFDDSVKFMSQEPAGHIVFKDHHPYRAQDVDDIRRKAKLIARENGQYNFVKVICTPKDAVKLRALGCDEFYTIDLRVEFSESIFFDETDSGGFDSWWSRDRLISYSQERIGKNEST
ncbi:MAG: tetraacyldisaccharide 4'-kinase [Desulfovibrio sp. S3730MH75]|nr:MAG: tetraacyldisaccharide 4'-kinase [Desulfovibrio sp. S3730MH75]